MYVRCNNCGWSQDDFWYWNWTWKFWKFRAFGYNPLQNFIDEIRVWIKPRFINIDHGKAFSWKILLKECFNILKNAKNMKWKTWNQYRKDSDKNCPKCGSNKLIVD